MKKRVLAIIICVILLLGYGVYWAFFDTQGIKGQEYLTSASSPNGDYTIMAYLNNGGATTAYAVLCRLHDNKTGAEKNVYWNYGDSAQIRWIDDTTVEINGVKLNILKDVYDFRHL